MCHTCTHKYAYECYISEMNDYNGTRGGREELRLSCYCKVLTLPMKEYNAI